MNSIPLNPDQFGLVYNVLSFGLVSMLACTIYTLVSQSRVLPKYRTALVMSSMVTFIAAYHYMRIFNSFEDSFNHRIFPESGDVGGEGSGDKVFSKSLSGARGPP